jgi:hypothetical protein
LATRNFTLSRLGLRAPRADLDAVAVGRIQFTAGIGLQVFQMVKSRLCRVASSTSMKTQIYLVPRSRIVELHLHSPIYFHNIVLN